MYKNIYYWAYSFYAKKKWEKDPEVIAYFLVCFIMLFHAAIIFVLLNFLFDFYHGQTFPWDTGKGKYSFEGLIIGISISLPFFILSYIFIYRKKTEIMQEYKQLKGKKQVRSKILFWVYIVVSVVLCFGALLFFREY